MTYLERAIKEAENVATNMINNENVDVFIVYGYGLGYIVNEIYKK